jgi:hypothetical protein
MIKVVSSGDFNMPDSDFLEVLAATSAAGASHRFLEFLKNRRFNELFQNQTDETRESINTYRLRGKKPAYVVKAGVGILGNLNYLAGLYRGKAVSKSGKVFSYARKRDLIKDGWKAWGGEGKLKAASEEKLKKMIAEAEKGK